MSSELIAQMLIIEGGLTVILAALAIYIGSKRVSTP